MSPSLQWRHENEKESVEYGRMVTFGKRRDECTGYMSYSDRVGPSVILLHEFFGLQDPFKDYADALNKEGFTVLAPDLYDGQIARSVEEAKGLSDALDGDRAALRLKAAKNFLADNWHPRVGVIGFSLGAWLGIQLAQDAGLEAAVAYYGIGDIDPAEFDAPLQFHLAEVDDWEPLEEVQPAIQGWIDAGVDAEVHVYEDTGHWFANPSMPDAFDAEAANLAWERTVEFLRHHLA